jgi:hypothetical protein
MKIREMSADLYSIESHCEAEACNQPEVDGRQEASICDDCLAGQEAFYNRLLEAAQHHEIARFLTRENERIEVMF